MNIYVDVLNKIAVTSDMDSTPAVRPDIRSPTTYSVNIYFLRSDGFGGFTYTRFPNAVITLNVRNKAPVEAGRFSLTFRGAETAEIDTRFSVDQVTQLLTALPSIGAGNVTVTKEKTSLTIEFTGSLAGQAALPAMTARVVSSTPTAAVPSVEILSPAIGSTNTIQKVTLRRPPLATTTIWTELGGTGTTPGWTGTLDMSAVPLSTWDSPVGDIVIEVKIAAQYARSASDGVTLTDGVGRTASDGQVVTSPGVTGSANVSDNTADSFMVAADVNGVYGRRFASGDVGRVITDSDGYLYPGTVIVEVIDDGVINAARLSQRYNQFGLGLAASINYTLAGLPSDVFYSPTANWTQADVGHVITSTAVPTGTRIVAIIDNHYVRLSQKATTTGGSLLWNIASDTRNVFQSATALFAMSDVGAKIRAPTMFDGDATILKWISTTQVLLDVRPKAVGTAVAWMLLPARAYPTPVVSRLAPGSGSAVEVQKIRLSQAAVAGQLIIQDSYGVNMPKVVLNNPVSTTDLQAQLKANYPNYGFCQVQEVLPGAEWNVTFGKVGNQRLLAVNDAQAVYEKAVLDWVIADGVTPPVTMQDTRRVEWTTGSPSVLRQNGMVYIGAASNADRVVVGLPRLTRLTDGTRAFMVKYKVMQFTERHTSPALNSLLSDYNYGTNLYFIGEEGGQDRNGVYTCDLVYVTLPPIRFEYHQMMRPSIIPRRTYHFGTPVDIQLESISISDMVKVKFTYYLEGTDPGQPARSQAASVIHYQAALAGDLSFMEIYPHNGFDVSDGAGTAVYDQYWSWTRRRWMGHIWEQRFTMDITSPA